MDPLADLGRRIGDIADRVGPSVVGIGSRWRGMGVVIGDGRVVTSAHNLRDDASVVTFGDGRTVEATILGADLDGDLAVLEVPTDAAPALEAATTTPTTGTPIVALARGREGVRATFGFVSAVDRSFRGPRGRRLTGAIEHTAPLLPGSSGGPVVDLDGRLVGIDTHRLGDGFYLALPTDDAWWAQVAALGRGEVPTRRHLGVGLAPSHVARRMRHAVGLAERDGVLVRDVEPGSAAASAGIETGDLIVAVDARPVRDADDLLEALAGEGPLGLTLVRGVEERSVEVFG